MELPFDLDADELLSILILRVLNCSDDTVANILHCSKTKVVKAEEWIKTADYSQALSICDDQSIKRVVARELVSHEDIDHASLVKAAQLTQEDILRHYREDHFAKAKIKRDDPRFLEHCDDLAEAADYLASIVGRLLEYNKQLNDKPDILIKDTDIFKDGKIAKVKTPFTYCMEYLEIHLKGDKEYTLENLTELSTENVTEVLLKRLNTLHHSKAFKPVSGCPICDALSFN